MLFLIKLLTLKNIQNFKAIDYKQIKKDFSTKGFKYLDMLSLLITVLILLSQMLNLNYNKNEKNNTFSSLDTFPFVMTKFNETRLSKTLNLMDYKFIWFGNRLANCKNYNTSLCLKII